MANSHSTTATADVADANDDSELFIARHVASSKCLINSAEVSDKFVAVKVSSWARRWPT
ncbi:hypothetical protein Plhal304r1_c035g0110011 [Plasmopara halstedii]